MKKFSEFEIDRQLFKVWDKANEAYLDSSDYVPLCLTDRGELFLYHSGTKEWEQLDRSRFRIEFILRDCVPIAHPKDIFFKKEPSK